MIERDYLDRIEDSLIHSHVSKYRVTGAWSVVLILVGVLFFGTCMWLTRVPETHSNEKAAALADMHLHNTSHFLG